MQETLAQSLGWEDPPEEETATHTNILARKIPWTRGPWHARVHGFAESDMIEHAKAGDMGLILAPRRFYMLWGNQAGKPQLLKPTGSATKEATPMTSPCTARRVLSRRGASAHCN